MKKLRLAMIKNCVLLMCAGASWGQVSQSAIETSLESNRCLPPGFLVKSIKLDENGPEYKYAMFIPPLYAANPNHRWPLILFLHGSQECGVDGIRQTTVGLPAYIGRHSRQFPFIVLMPQAQSPSFKGVDEAAVWKILDENMKGYRVDESRVYITGISMGGSAVWQLALARPSLFAAIVPISGSVPGECRDYLCNLSTIPIWAFQGEQDTIVSADASRNVIEELRRLNGVWPKYTEYFDLGHLCWNRAYADRDFWKWLLAQKRRIPKVITYRAPSGSSKFWWLAIKTQENAKTPARIRAEINDANQVNVESEGIASWELSSDKDPLRLGVTIQVNWNGAMVYRGAFWGALEFNAQDAPETQSPFTTAPVESGTYAGACNINDSGADKGDGGMKPPLRANDHVLGSASATVTVIQYSDFQCHVCAQFAREVYPIIKAQFIETGKVRWVSRHFPVPGHPRAEIAARASECASDQGAFFQYVDLTFATTGNGMIPILTTQQLQENAAAIGLDTAAFNACFLSDESNAARVRQSIDSGKALGVTGVPTFLINDLRVAGFQTADQMSALINQKLGS